MNYQQLLEKLTPFVKKNIIVLALGFFGLIFLGYGLIGLIGRNNHSPESFIFESGTETKSNPDNPINIPTSSSNNVSQIAVDIEGAVLKPGVYQIPADSRLKDALVAAGGLSQTADRDWVSKNLNLSQKLADGAKIYVPKIGELETESIKGIKSIKGGDVEGKININTASIQELDSLTSIGLVTAQKIIDNRPYSSIDELVKKKIVGQKVFEQIRGKITVY